MGRHVLVLSGPVAAGKSTLANALNERFGIVRFKTQDMIRRLTGAELDRAKLQAGGAALDRKSKGNWVANELMRALTQPGPDEQPISEAARVLLDSARLPEQIEAIRRAFGQSVVHIHVTAPEQVLKTRYESRVTEMVELPSYAALRTDSTESVVDALATSADIVVDTSRSTPDDVVVRVAAQLGLYGRGCDRLVDVLIGGEFGSEGKGQIAAYLAPEYDVLVRVGGPNAGHKVYEEPATRTFHHLPSGTTRNQGATIVLGPGSVILVPELLREIASAEVSFERLAIDPQAVLIEDMDIEGEKGLVTSIGSTGRGVGAATARKVLRTLASQPVRLAKDSRELRPYIRPTLEVLDDAFAQGKRIFLEGTQGTGLSLHHGAYPHVTSRDTTAGGCLGEAGIAPGRVRKTIMVCRTYPIRVQSPEGKTSGPMSMELTWDDISGRSGIPVDKLLEAEKTSTTNKQRRIGEFDWVLVRKAASLNAPTDIALTFVDYLTVKNRKARRLDQLSPETIQFIAEVERVTTAQVSLISTRFAYRAIIDRRMW